jgi:virulence-associated protein VapD
MEKLNDTPNMPELIGFFRQQVKPCFDVDAYNQDIDIHEIIAKINALFPNKKVNVAKREPREYKDKGIKYSYRFYVDGVRMTTKNLKKYLNDNGYTKDNEPFDLSIYDSNKMLLLPLTTKKFNDTVHPPLIPIDCEIFDCCASYIKEDFEDWDSKFAEVKPEIKKITKNVEDDDTYTNKDRTFILNKLKEHIAVLTDSRSSGFDTWFKMVCCISNICNKYQLSQRNKIELIHQFSHLASDYNEDKVDEWIDKTLSTLKDGYAWNYLIQAIKEDNKDYYEKNFSQTYVSVKKEFEKHCFKCMKPLGFIVLNEDVNDYDSEILQVLKKKELLEARENKNYIKCEEDKKGNKKWVKTPFIKDWLKDENIKTYEKLIFTPEHLSAEASKKYYNLFNGFKAELLPICKNYESIQPVLDHMKIVLCNNNETHYDWLLQYYANILQNPTKKTDTVIVYKGTQGCGKSIFVDNFANNIIGENYSVSTANPERQLLGNFNGLLLNKVFAVCNEVGNDMRPLINRLKDLATAPDNVIEKKGKEPIRNKNYINMNMTTNDNNPIDIQNDDRRICWFNCNHQFVGNKEYFRKLASCFDNDEDISSLYHYLKEEVEITITDFQITRPITKEYEAIKRLNTPNYIKFLIDYFSEKENLNFRKYRGVNSQVMRVTCLYSEYKRWCENTTFKPYNKSVLEEKLKEKETGIVGCTYDGYPSFRFIESDFNKWLDKFRVKAEDIEVISNEDFDD